MQMLYQLSYAPDDREMFRSSRDDSWSGARTPHRAKTTPRVGVKPERIVGTRAVDPEGRL